ncbi:MAG: endonuclease Q family protein [Chitinivibrionales bacterium]|nr:endonuclease Q family protein [Chitinivibrionales bacterium]
MKFIADLHIHSPFSRATSPALGFESLSVWGALKGVTLSGTGDCVHPGWLKIIAEKLRAEGNGLYRLKNNTEAQRRMPISGFSTGAIRFILTGEISTIYKYNGKTRKVHHLVVLPSLAAATAFSRKLGRIGNINADGRPILGLDSRDLLEILLECAPEALLIPAHIWTPWFSVLGSKSGFDAIEDCYRDLSDHIFALETGLSSDPPMNWTVSALDRFTLVSNSDAHSPARLGREATIFSGDLTYPAIRNALQHKNKGGFGGTIEFFPAEGKYHYDGHRKCKICFSPQQSIAAGGVCPRCGTPLTLGVAYRVAQLADRPCGRKPADAPPYFPVLALPEILGELIGVGPVSKAVQRLYFSSLSALGSELFILLEASRAHIQKQGGELLAEAIMRMRAGTIFAKPGCDGEYGVVRIFAPGELKKRQDLAAK